MAVTRRAVLRACEGLERTVQSGYHTLAQTTLVLSPGRGLGPFRLGQPLPEVLALLRSGQLRATFRCVEVKWPQGPTAQQGDLALCFPEHGMHLLFDGTQQRLRLVEVYDTTRLQVRFGAHVFGGAAHAPTFGRVCEALGPTYPGEAAGGLYPLQYPGMLFLFPTGSASSPAGPPLGPLQQQQQQQQRQPQLAPGSAQLPVPLSTPAARIVVHYGTAASLAAARSAPPPPLPPGGTYWERVEVLPCQGLLLGTGGQLLRFGDSPQDVVSELGPPSNTHTKPARPGAAAGGLGLGQGPGLAGAPAAPDYYYCYASRGFDVLFCGATHRLKKLVLHANQPGHPDFGLYSRCNFRVHAAGSWSLPGNGSTACGSGSSAGEGVREGGEAGDSPVGTYTSAGSDGGASMRTAASEASLAATEAAAAGSSPQLQGAAAFPAAAVRSAAGKSPQLQGGLQQPLGEPQPASGLTAAYNTLVRLIDDVMHIDGSSGSSGKDSAGAEAQAAASAMPAPAPAGPSALADAGAEASGTGECGSVAAATATHATAMGRPPRPPTSLPIPAPVPPPPVSSVKPTSTTVSSKKKKKKEKRAAAAAAKLLAAGAAGGAGGGDESAAEATDTDASFADSAPSSLASSPGMTSFLSSIAATGGGLGPGGPSGSGGAAAGPASGYSSESSTAGFAAKERRLENGSAYDGWSEAEDLALLVGGEEAPAGAPAPGCDGGSGGASDPEQPEQQRPEQQQQPQEQRALRVSTAVQTAPGAEEEALGAGGLLPGQLGAGASSAFAADPDSPESYVLADSPALFDESAAAAEYESVPRQRSSGTQTHPHLLVGPPLRSGSAAGGAAGSASSSGGVGQLRRGPGAAAAAASKAAVVDVCSSLADLQAVFGAGAKPALHTRLGGRHPFGPTHLFAYRGVVFEVLHNGCIATVTLFEA